MKLGFALRPTVFPPALLSRVLPLLERAGARSVWFPAVGPNYDVLDVSAFALGATSRALIGTGVIRAGDSDPSTLVSRLRTLGDSSGGRFILGVGSGRSRGPEAIKGVETFAQRVKVDYGSGGKLPIFFAALRGGMLRSAIANADGAILNFCSPSHVARILPKDRPRKGFTLACYIKLFFGKTDAQAGKMLIEEFSNYNQAPSYHSMFEAMGVADKIDESAKSGKVPDELMDIALANPTSAEVLGLLRRFAKAGVDVPIVYPYVSGTDGYKLAVIRKLSSVA